MTKSASPSASRSTKAGVARAGTARRSAAVFMTARRNPGRVCRIYGPCASWSPAESLEEYYPIFSWCDMNEIIFLVQEAPEGGFEAKALSAPLFTEADSLEELRAMVRDEDIAA